MASRDEAVQAQKRVQSEKEQAIQARKEAEEKSQVLTAEALEAERSEAKTVQKYRVILAFFLTLSTFQAVAALFQNLAFLNECGRWFFDRGGDIIFLSRSVASGFMAIIAKMNEAFPSISIAWGYLVAIVVYLIIFAGVGFFFVLCCLFIGRRFQSIRDQYKIGHLKAVLSAACGFGCFYMLLSFYSPIKAVLDEINVFSLWIVLTLLFIFICNAKEIVIGIQEYSRYH